MTAVPIPLRTAEVGNERGRVLVQALTDRAFTAVLDLEAASLLPASVP